MRNLSVQWIFSWNHIDQLAEHEIIQCGEQLVELGGIGALGVVLNSQEIIHLIAAHWQPPVLNAAFPGQQRNHDDKPEHATRYSEQHKGHKHAKSKEELCCY